MTLFNKKLYCLFDGPLLHGSGGSPSAERHSENEMLLNALIGRIVLKYTSEYPEELIIDN